MIDDGTANFSADDLALVSDADDGADAGQQTDVPADDASGAKGADQTPPAKKADEGEQKPAPSRKPTIASGDEPPEEEPEDDKPVKADPNVLTDDLRKLIAEHYAAGDKKAEKQELRRLDRIKDVKSLWGMYREIENKFHSGGLTKVPGKDATDEEKSAFQKALGWTEKPEEMVSDLKLENGAVIGDEDKPVLAEFAQAVHGATSGPEFMNKAASWYFARQEEAAAAQDDADEDFRIESERALKEEYGPAFKRTKNSIGTIFANAPGGVDTKNENALITRLLGGRTSDNKLIGNDPDIIRWMAGLAFIKNPHATTTEDGTGDVKTSKARLEEIKKMRSADRKRYDSPEIQAEELELIEALKISQ